MTEPILLTTQSTSLLKLKRWSVLKKSPISCDILFPDVAFVKSKLRNR